MLCAHIVAWTMFKLNDQFLHIFLSFCKLQPIIYTFLNCFNGCSKMVEIRNGNWKQKKEKTNLQNSENVLYLYSVFVVSLTTQSALQDNWSTQSKPCNLSFSKETYHWLDPMKKVGLVLILISPVEMLTTVILTWSPYLDAGKVPKDSSTSK